jgi:hypothetical protein
MHLSSQDTWEAGIWRITVPDQLKPKSLKNCISGGREGGKLYVYVPVKTLTVGNKIVYGPGQPGQKARLYLQNNPSIKDCRADSNGRVPASQVQTPAPPKK